MTFKTRWPAVRKWTLPPQPELPDRGTWANEWPDDYLSVEL
jgi:hypothetical protein